MEDYLENVAAEVTVLRRKLQSKAEALLILTQELDHCRIERDQFKILAEQTQNKNLSKKTFDDQASKAKLPFSNGIQSSSFDHYLEIKEQNKSLRYEIQDLKQKLREAYGDIKVLRAGTADSAHLGTGKEATPAHQREELVEQLEQMGARVTQLESDLRGVLDEKEELITERESYRAKVFRLNHQINTLLKCDSARLIDLDALIMDNKYQQEQLQQLKAEKELAQQALVKYKSMLEKKKNKGIVKLGNNNSTMVVSHKQVQELLQRGTAAQMPNTEATLDDLRSLCLALLEALQDKTLALAHQKKANKILASRISELEHRLGANVPVFPSELLMQGYPNIEEKLLTDHPTSHDQSQEKPQSKHNLHEEKSAITSGSSNITVLDETTDSLPEDIQELVTKALQQIHEESKAS